MSCRGDLNYRIDLPRSVVIANARSQNLPLLLEHDQLLKEMKTNAAFRLRSFREAEISFNPTYRYDRCVHLRHPRALTRGRRR